MFPREKGPALAKGRLGKYRRKQTEICKIFNFRSQETYCVRVPKGVVV